MISVLLLLLPLLAFAVDDASDSFINRIKGTDEFNSHVIDSYSLWLVNFYDSTAKESQEIRGFTTIANLVRGIVPTAIVDISDPDNSGLKKYTNKTRSLTLFGDDKTKPIDLSNTSDPNDVLNRIMQEVALTIQARGGGGGGEAPQEKKQHKKAPDSKVVTITADNIAEKVYNNPLVTAVAFVAPWCGHCKALLPEWEAASKKLEGEGAQLGVVDATVEEDLARQYGVEGFPTIKVFPGGAKKRKSDAMDYEGGRQESQIVQYVLEEVDRSGVPKEIPELIDSKVMDETCVSGRSRLCVLFALPHILDSGAEGRNKYMEIMRGATKAVRGMGFEYAWFEGGSEQGKLEQVLGLEFGFPAVVAYSHKKGVYIPFRFSFQESNIRKFLTGLTSGKQQSFTISEVPYVKTVEPWDGKDGVPIEEESLADIMGDDWNDEF